MEEHPAYHPINNGSGGTDLPEYASLSTSGREVPGRSDAIPPTLVVVDEYSGRQRAKRRWITVELIVVLMASGFGGLASVKGQYLRHRVAMDVTHNNQSLNISQSACDMENGTKEINDEIQALTSQWTLYFSLANALPALFSTLFLGTLSERVGRRLAIVTPCAGLMLSCIVVVSVVYLDLPLAVLFAGEVIAGFTGGLALLMAGAFAYIADITTEKQRMVRIVLIEMLVFAGIGLMQVGVGFIIKDFGFSAAIWVPFAALSASVVNGLFPFFLIETIDTAAVQDRGRLSEALTDIVHLFKVNKDNRRRVLLAFFAITLSVGIVIQSGIALTVLYGQGQPFCWESVTIGFYTSISLIIPGLGMIGGAGIFPYCCKLGNLWIMQISNISGMANTLAIGLTYFFQSTPLIFASTFLGVFKLLGVPVIRTTMSTIVEKHEHGAVFAALGVVDGLGMFLSPLIMNAIYSATVRIMSTTVFFVMSSVMFIPVVIVGFLQCTAFGKKQPVHTSLINVSDEDKALLEN